MLVLILPFAYPNSSLLVSLRGHRNGTSLSRSLLLFVYTGRSFSTVCFLFNAKPPFWTFDDNNNNGFDLFNQNDMDSNGSEDEEDQDEDGEKDDEDDEYDPMATLPAADHEALIEDAATVRTMLDKVRNYLFSHSNGSHRVSDPKAFICSHSIHKHRPACLA